MSSLEKLENFFTKFLVINYKKGETILRGGDNPLGVFYLKKGYVKLHSLSCEGEELTLVIFKTQDFFPLMWAINDSPNEYYLEAMTPVEVWRCPRDEFIQFLKNNPDVFLELTSRILVRLGGILKRMEYLVFGNAHAKVASILVICGQRFGRNISEGILVQVPLTHKDIANLVGVSRETASIEIKKLERLGLIGHKGRYLVIKDKKGLEEKSLFEAEI